MQGLLGNFLGVGGQQNQGNSGGGLFGNMQSNTQGGGSGSLFGNTGGGGGGLLSGLGGGGSGMFGGGMNSGQQQLGTLPVKFQPPKNKDQHLLHTINAMRELKDKSLEELRQEDYKLLKNYNQLPDQVKQALTSKMQGNSIVYLN